MARPPKSLLKDSHPHIAAEVVDQSLLPTLATGADRKIQFRCPDHGHIYEARPYNRTNAKSGGTGCPVCNGKQILIGFNDIATTQPQVAALFIDPEDGHKYTQKSNKKVPMRCPQGHEWDGKISNIVSQSLKSGHLGCPYCAGRKSVKGQDDLATTHPDIAAQLVDQSLAHTLKAGSNTRVEWQCHIDKRHQWYANPYDRTTKHNGCPFCSGRNVTPGVNDIATTDPFNASRLADPAMATQVSKGSDKIVTWRCLSNPAHTWENKVYNETLNQFPSCPHCREAQTSAAEKDLRTVVAMLVGDDNMSTSNRTLLGNYQELDIVVEDPKVAIEYNGVYWHSEERKGKDYHREKTQRAANADYQLIHVWEDDYIHRRDVTIRAIAHKLGKTDKVLTVLPHANPKIAEQIAARKLTLGEATGAEARKFLNENHMQGAVTATKHFCLRDHDGDIRAILSVRSPRNSARMKRSPGQWEIQRYATCGIVAGGFTRLMAHAEKTLVAEGHKLTQWISFSSHDNSDGNMYAANGFIVDKILSPDYKYVGAYTRWRRAPKEKFQKKTFKNTPELKYDPTWTERECAEHNGLWRVYDSGKTRWVKQVH